MTAGDVTAEMIADLQFQIMQGSEGPMQERHETQFRQQVVADLLAALEASRAEVAALRRQLEERRAVVTVPREYLEMLQSAANRFCSSCRDNNASCSMTARHFGGTGCGAWKLDGTRINALRSGEAVTKEGD